MTTTTTNATTTNRTSETRAPKQGRKRTFYVILSVVLAAGACGLLAYSIAKGSGVYIKVDELVKERESWVEKKVWLGGRLAHPPHETKASQGSSSTSPELETSKKKKRHVFVLEWKGARVPVVFHGDLPPRFTPGIQVTARGKLSDKAVDRKSVV